MMSLLCSRVFYALLVVCSVGLWAEPQSASSWSLRLNDDAAPLALSLTHEGKVPTDVWLQQRRADGSVVMAIRLVEALTPGEIFEDTVDLKALGFEAEGRLLVYAAQRFALQAVDLSAASKRASIALRPESTAEVTRDALGRWFIEGGESFYDVAEQMGYSVAQDRLFQVDLFRRNALGRLAEIFGPDFLEQDILARSFGYSDAEYQTYFESLDQVSKDLYQGYADGLNRHIAELNANPVAVPAEFLLMGMTQLEPWTPTDVMAWVGVLQRNFSLTDLGFRQVENGLMLQALTQTYGGFPGVAKFLDFNWANDAAAPTMIPKDKDNTAKAAAKMQPVPQLLTDAPDLSEAVREMRRLFEKRDANLKKIGAYVKGGSYAWVLSGSRTESGNPILYSGPQMGFDAPIILSEGSIESDVVSVSGMTIAGVPAIIVGRSPRHAWSLQVGHAHSFDYYLEQDTDVFVHRVETFEILGQDPVQQPMLRSARGPIVNAKPLISWKYANWGREWDISAFMDGLANAQSPEDFGAALERVAVSQHFCYADQNGDIAYWMSGSVPVRPRGEYRVPQGFVGTPREWDANVLEPLPFAKNPSQGWFAGWNNKSTPKADDSASIWRYGSTHRSHVVSAQFQPGEVYSYEDVRDFALNVAMTRSVMGGGNPWVFIGDAFDAAVRQQPTGARLEALALMERFSGQYPAGGREDWPLTMDVDEAWMLMDTWVRNVIGLLFDDDLAGNPARLSFRIRFEVLVRLLTDISDVKVMYQQYARNLSDPDAPQTMEDTIVFALDQALATLGERPWGVAARDLITYDHPLFGTLATTPWASRSTWAQIVEVGPSGVEKIETMFPLGQSQTFNIGESGPMPHPLFFGMHQAFNSFTHIAFPLFKGQPSNAE